MANIGTQTTNEEVGDNQHIAVPPNNPVPTVVTLVGGAGGITIRR
jgi:hypothetical protein